MTKRAEILVTKHTEFLEKSPQTVRTKKGMNRKLEPSDESSTVTNVIVSIMIHEDNRGEQDSRTCPMSIATRLEGPRQTPDELAGEGAGKLCER